MSTIQVKGLDALLMALKAKPPVCRVGILSNRTHYTVAKPGQKLPKHAPTNAEIGAAHEYGAPARGLPQRSFLRVPISENLEKYMSQSGAFTSEVLKKVLQDKTVVPWLKKVGVLAEAIVSDAFDTGGFGRWPAWKNPNYRNIANQLLVDTQQLRNSITHEVKE